MKENLLIVFCKNPVLGKVKTRLAAQIGNENALTVYKKLLTKTAQVINDLSCDIILYYSDSVIEDDEFNTTAEEKKVQQGLDLGARMANAFKNGFKAHEKIVIIGTDLWTLDSQDIENAFSALEQHTAVLGPSLDGGYYLLGLKKFIPRVFENKAWGTSEVFSKTMVDLKENEVCLLNEKNDIDTLEDLQQHPDLEACIH